MVLNSTASLWKKSNDIDQSQQSISHSLAKASMHNKGTHLHQMEDALIHARLVNLGELWFFHFLLGGTFIIDVPQ